MKPCLESAMAEGVATVYVDSGSTDGSVELARETGAQVHELSPDQPFNAARARNEGLAQLSDAEQDPEFVQFLDGDSSLESGWLQEALSAMESDARLCAVFGRIEERHPELSIFNRYTAVEWNSPAGEALSFGGICLCRISALLQVGGFDRGLVAGEEPELSSRLRREGWRIRSLPVQMAVHDAGMTSFAQWFKRCIRTGYVYAQASRSKTGTDRVYGLRPSLRIWAWSCVLPLMIVVVAVVHPLLALLMMGLYPLQTLRMAVSFRRQGMGLGHALWCGALWHLSQFGQWRGQCRYWFDRMRRSEAITLDSDTQAMTSVFDKKADATSDVRQEG